MRFFSDMSMISGSVISPASILSRQQEALSHQQKALSHQQEARSPSTPSVRKHMRSMVCIIACLGVLQACSSSSRSSTTYDGKGDEAAGGGWFCEVAANNEDWNCVRDPNLVRNPSPSRLPAAAEATEGIQNPANTADNTDTNFANPSNIRPTVERDPATSTQTISQNTPAGAEPPSVEKAAKNATSSGAPSSSRQQASSATQINEDTQAGQNTGKRVPKHIQLSYQPDKPVSLLDLPEQFWVVQLVSVSSKEALEKYAREHQLRGMSAARIWSKDQYFYILILGIYETYNNATQAIEDLPPPFDKFPPWIRSVGSLQKAMLEADRRALNGE